MDKPPDGASDKPARLTQFPPGQSGNPRGRPKVNREPASVFHAIMDARIPITVNGKCRMVSGFEASVLRLRQDAMNGKPHAIKQLRELYRQFPRPTGSTSNLTTDELHELWGGYDDQTKETIRQFTLKEETLQERRRRQKV